TPRRREDAPWRRLVDVPGCERRAEEADPAPARVRALDHGRRTDVRQRGWHERVGEARAGDANVDALESPVARQDAQHVRLDRRRRVEAHEHRIAGQGAIRRGAEPLARWREKADARVVRVEGDKGVTHPGKGVEGVELARSAAAPPDRTQMSAVATEDTDLVRLHIGHVD